MMEELARRPAAKDLSNLMTMTIEIDYLFYTVHKRANHAINNGNTSRKTFHNNSFSNHRSNLNNNNSLNHKNNGHAPKQFNNYKNQQRNNQYRTFNSNNSNPSSSNNQMGNRFSSNSSSTPAPFSSASPMELGAINEYKPLSAPVKEFRRINGLCMYCGEANHQVADCPKKKPMGNMLGSIIELDLLGSREFVPASLCANVPAPATSTTFPMNTIQEVTKSNHNSMFLVPVSIFHGNNEELSISAEAMVDTGASSNFISRQLVDSYCLELTCCAPGEEVFFRLANNSIYISRYTSTILLRIGNTMHEEVITMRVIEMTSFAVILGMPWLRRHCPSLHFHTMQLSMNCLSNTRCIPVRYEDMMEDTTSNATNTLPPILTTVSQYDPNNNEDLTSNNDPFFGTTSSVCSNVELPPTEFGATTIARLVEGLQNQQDVLDDWVQENRAAQWAQLAGDDDWWQQPSGEFNQNLDLQEVERIRDDLHNQWLNAIQQVDHTTVLQPRSTSSSRLSEETTPGAYTPITINTTPQHSVIEISDDRSDDESIYIRVPGPSIFRTTAQLFQDVEYI